MTNSQVEDQINKIMDENNLTYGFKLDFPKYRQLPEEVLLAISVLRNHGMKVIITLDNK